MFACARTCAYVCMCVRTIESDRTKRPLVLCLFVFSAWDEREQLTARWKWSGEESRWVIPDGDVLWRQGGFLLRVLNEPFAQDTFLPNGSCCQATGALAVSTRFPFWPATLQGRNWSLTKGQQPPATVGTDRAKPRPLLTLVWMSGHCPVTREGYERGVRDPLTLNENALQVLVSLPLWVRTWEQIV